MLSKGDVHFNPVCLHATAVSLHSRPHRQTGPEPHEQQQQQQLQHKSSCLYWTFQGHLLKKEKKNLFLAKPQNSKPKNSFWNGDHYKKQPPNQIAELCNLVLRTTSTKQVL